MHISLDHGATWQNVEQVRITYDLDHVPGEDGIGELHLNLTPEGIITDLWVCREEVHNLATRSQTVDEHVQQLIEENS